MRLGGLVPRDTCARLHAALTDGVASVEEPLLRVFTSREEPHRTNASGHIVNAVMHPGRLDIPGVHGLEQDLFRDTELVPIVRRLLGDAPQLLQSAWWQSSEGTALHRDAHPTDATAPMIGAWIALEDIAFEAGPFLVVDGTHRLTEADPEFGAYLTKARASYERQYVDRAPDLAMAHEADVLLAAFLARRAFDRVAFPVPAGDVILWDKDVLHGSLRPAPGGPSRSSLLMHFVI